MPAAWFWVLVVGLLLLVVLGIGGVLALLLTKYGQGSSDATGDFVLVDISNDVSKIYPPIVPRTAVVDLASGTQVNRPLFADLKTAHGTGFTRQLYRRVVLPMTHDSATGYMASDPTRNDGTAVPWGPESGILIPLALALVIKAGQGGNAWDYVFGWARTQYGGMTFQLQGGVRAFDWRLWWSTSRNRMEFQHGARSESRVIVTKPVLDAVDEVKAYVNANPDEIVLLNLTQLALEDGNLDRTALVFDLVTAVRTRLGPLLLDKTMVPDLDTATVGDIWATTGRIILFTDTPDTSGLFSQQSYGVLDGPYTAPRDTADCTDRTLVCTSWQQVMDHYLHCFAYDAGRSAPFYLQSFVQVNAALLLEKASPNAQGDDIAQLASTMNAKIGPWLSTNKGAARDTTPPHLNAVEVDFYEAHALYQAYLDANAQQLRRDSLIA